MNKHLIEQSEYLKKVHNFPRGSIRLSIEDSKHKPLLKRS